MQPLLSFLCRQICLEPIVRPHGCNLNKAWRQPHRRGNRQYEILSAKTALEIKSLLLRFFRSQIPKCPNRCVLLFWGRRIHSRQYRQNGQVRSSFGK